MSQRSLSAPGASGYALSAPSSSAASSLSCPGQHDRLRIDDHLVQPETPFEMVRGRLEAMPCKPGHGDPHFRLDYLLGAHVADGWVGSTDLLTRWSQDSDFASDTCIRREGIDPRTGERYLEEITFEIVNEQSQSSVRERAEDMARMGVRRIFALFVKRGEVAEWSAGAWELLDLDEVIEDECLVRPLPVRALLDRQAVDNAAAQALIERKVPAIERYGLERLQQGLEAGEKKGLEAGEKKGLEAGEKKGLEAGEKKMLRESILDICELLGIEVSPQRRAHLDGLGLVDLRALRLHLKQARAWPL